MTFTDASFIMKRQLPSAAVCGIDRVLQIDEIVVDHRRGLAGGADLARTRRRHDAVRLRRAGTGGEVRVGDAAEALHQAVADERLDIGVAVLEQLDRHGHDLRAVLVDRQGDDAERRVGAGRGGVLREQLAGFRRAVRGREVHVDARVRAQDVGDGTHAAIGLHCVEHAGGDFDGDGVAALRTRGGRHGVVDRGPVLGRQTVVTDPQPLGEQRRCRRVLVAAQAGRGLDQTAGDSFVSDPRVEVRDALDLSVERLDLGHARVVGRLLGIAPSFVLVVDQGVQLPCLCRALLAESLNAHRSILP
jgi:hypothetical protein